MSPRRFACCVALALLAGCGSASERQPVATVHSTGPQSDAQKVRAADYSILFVGNSHTSGHDLPSVVCEMIRFRHPGKTTYAHTVSVMFLEDTARDPRCKEEIESRPWKFVVLQAQKISVSGKHEYSRAEGIDLARLAKARGAAVFYFAEWGLQGKAGDGPRQEKVYREMAREAGVEVAAVGRAWDIALAARPELPLYSGDGNHQSPTGAFLTACYLYARLTGESPSALASFPHPGVSDADRKFLADAAAKAAEQK